MTPLIYVLMCLAGGDGSLDLTADERFWRDQSKVREPRELLAPFYGWFTEGFDTRDLKDEGAARRVGGLKYFRKWHDADIP